MFNVGSFFDKFNKGLIKELRLREAIARIIQEYTSIALDIKDIECKHKVIRIKASPIARNQIFMKKEKILEAVKRELPGTLFTDLQ